MNINSMLIGIALGSLGATLGSFLVFEQYMTRIDRRLLQSPPVVVVDFAKIAVESYPKGAATSEIESLLVKTNNAVTKLKNAGYIVIDSEAVVAAPKAVYFPDDLVQ